MHSEVILDLYSILCQFVSWKAFWLAAQQTLNMRIIAWSLSRMRKQAGPVHLSICLFWHFQLQHHFGTNLFDLQLSSIKLPSHFLNPTFKLHNL